MPGTDVAADSFKDLADRLTAIGWLLLGGELGFILFQLERVRSAGGTRFATAWEQRVETFSFLALPPQMTVLVAPAAVAVVAAVLSSGRRNPWLDVLVRVTALIAVLLIVVAVLSIIEIVRRDGTFEFGAVMLRLAGLSMSAAVLSLCQLATRSARD